MIKFKNTGKLRGSMNPHPNADGPPAPEPDTPSDAPQDAAGASSTTDPAPAPEHPATMPTEAHAAKFDIDTELAKFKPKDFAPNHLAYHLHKAIASERTPRAFNVVHASDLDPERHWCPREPALLTKHNLKRPMGFLSTAQAVTFRFGNKAADILIEALPSEIVWGNWKCRSCGHEHLHQYRPPKCYECGGKSRNLRYGEVFMRDPMTGLVGSCDIWVDLLNNGWKIPVEVKSEGNASFKARNKADLGHEWRTKLYLWIASQTPWLKDKKLDLTQGRVIYVTKEGHTDAPHLKKWGLKDWSKTPFKEYWVHRDDDASWEKRAKVTAYRAWRDAFDKDPDNVHVDLPDRICQTPNATPAKSCSVCNLCFGKT